MTALAPTLFAAAAEVAAEPCGILSAVDLRMNPKAAYGDSVTIPIAPTGTLGDYTPAMTTTEGTTGTASSVTITHTANKQASFVLTGEEQLSLSKGTGGDNLNEYIKQNTKQAMRVLRNAAGANYSYSHFVQATNLLSRSNTFIA
jgi:hypothetical protein